MSPTLTRPADAPTRKFLDLWSVIAVLGVIALAVATLRVVDSPRFVERVGVRNPSDLLVDVEVADAGRNNWMPVAIVMPGSRGDAEAVIDQGDEWVFRFRSGAVDGGELRVSRDELEHAGWRVTIPDLVIERMHRAGAHPAASGGY